MGFEVIIDLDGALEFEDKYLIFIEKIERTFFNSLVGDNCVWGRRRPSRVFQWVHLDVQSRMLDGQQ